MKKRILFICRGNVGRSQIAEALCRKEFDDMYEVQSAGTKLSGGEQTIASLSPATDNVIAVMKETGVDISSALRKSLTPEMVDNSEIVIATVDIEDPVPDYVVQNKKTLFWSIPDPKGKDLDETRIIRDKIHDLLLINFGSKK